MLQDVVDWVEPVFEDGLVLVVNRQYAKEARRQIASQTVRVLEEPSAQGTMIAIASAASALVRENPNATFAIINSDVHVTDVLNYRRTLEVLRDVVAALPDHLALVGVAPTYPETGYGYIETGEAVCVGGRDVHHVKGFKEKPDVETALEYVKSKTHLWNPTIISGGANTFLRAVERHVPSVSEALRMMLDGTALERVYAALPERCPSVDYGVLEHERDMVVLQGDFGWTDLGSWKTVSKRAQTDERGNTTQGNAILHDTKSSFVRNETGVPVAVVGLEDVVVVATGEGILVTHKDASKNVREVAMRVANIKNVSPKHVSHESCVSVSS